VLPLIVIGSKITARCREKVCPAAILPWGRSCRKAYSRASTARKRTTGLEPATLGRAGRARGDLRLFTHVYLRQRYKGIEVDGGHINVNVGRDGSIINLGNSFVSNLAAAVNRSSPERWTRTPQI
jgi:hypothetical protein